METREIEVPRGGTNSPHEREQKNTPNLKKSVRRFAVPRERAAQVSTCTVTSVGVSARGGRRGERTRVKCEKSWRTVSTDRWSTLKNDAQVICRQRRERCSSGTRNRKPESETVFDEGTKVHFRIVRASAEEENKKRKNTRDVQ